MARLEVKIGDLKLKNPVTTASGTFGYGTEYKDFIDHPGKYIDIVRTDITDIEKIEHERQLMAAYAKIAKK